MRLEILRVSLTSHTDLNVSISQQFCFAEENVDLHWKGLQQKTVFRLGITQRYGSTSESSTTKEHAWAGE